MKIKTKLTLGVGLLFLLIILLSVMATVYINSLKSDTNNILQANYKSLEYTRNMFAALEENSPEAMQRFGSSLELEEQNITEIGEKEMASTIRADFNRLRTDTGNTGIKKDIRKSLALVMEMNMEGIQRKSAQAGKTATNASIYIAIAGSCCFLIAFVLLVNLPAHIANPIKYLTKGIEEIANKNYAERIYLENHNEYGALARSFNTMAQKLEEYNNSSLAGLMMEKKRIETLINNMHDPVIGLDEQLRILFANEEAFRLAGLTAADMIGRQAQDVAVGNDLVRKLIEDLVLPVPGKASAASPLKIFFNDKESYFEKETVRISIVPTGEQTSRLIGHVILLKDITTYKELDTAKTNFIATVSHEFKTPIASIKMSLQLLENERIGSLNPEQQQLVNSIREDAGRLLKITGELLNMTQVESGHIQLTLHPAAPAEILQYALEANKTTADQKQVRLRTVVPRDLPLVMADHEKTAWVLTNLISNAIRYSHEDTDIELSITTSENKIRFAVKDSGQGIAPEYLSRIFDRYFKVPGTRKEGTGLGLAISKEFIEAQGGHINVESEFGSGSTFTVTLNAATA